MSRRQPPRLQAHPAEDLAFRRFVAEAFAQLLADASDRPDEPLDPADLQWRLRTRYPSVVVRERHPLAASALDELVWYVFRFGSVTPARRWWDEPGHAWAVLDQDRRIVEASSSLDEIVELPRDRIIGERIDAFANPADVSARADVEGLWQELLERGELHSTLRFAHSDGTPREIEYHVTRDGAGPNRHMAVVREIEVRSS